jgi:hypothetical protein
MNNKRGEGSLDKPANPKAKLQLTTSIVEQNYHCSNYVGFKVRLMFKNVGTEPVILDKRSFIYGKMVSRDLEAVAAKQYETEGRYDLFDPAYFNVDPSDMSNFIVLKPGEVYAFNDGVGSFWIDAGTPPRKGHLNPGTHFLQLKVSTWSYFTDANPFHQKWRDKGVLWSEGIISEPMPFTVEEKLPFVKCP